MHVRPLLEYKKVARRNKVHFLSLGKKLQLLFNFYGVLLATIFQGSFVPDHREYCGENRICITQPQSTLVGFNSTFYNIKKFKADN